MGPPVFLGKRYFDALSLLLQKTEPSLAVWFMGKERQLIETKECALLYLHIKHSYWISSRGVGTMATSVRKTQHKEKNHGPHLWHV